jgi:YD repeat-containing protein
MHTHALAATQFLSSLVLFSALGGCTRPPVAPGPPRAAPPAPTPASRPRLLSQPLGAHAPGALEPATHWKDLVLTTLPVAPSFYAPAVGSEPAPGCKVSVDPERGHLSLFVTDFNAEGVVLRRVLHSGYPVLGPAPQGGLFGSRWFGELDARLLRVAEGYLVVRQQGSTLFRSRGSGFVSAWGDEETLRRRGEGFELNDFRARRWRFDAHGRLIAMGELELAYGERRILVRAAGGTSTLLLDAAGRVVGAQLPAATLSYSYDREGRLVEVRGSSPHRYAYRHDRLRQVRSAEGIVLAVRYDDRGRPRELRTPQGVQRYSFVGGRRLTSATVHRTLGTWTYLSTPAGWEIDSPLGRERVNLDARGRPTRVGRGGTSQPDPGSVAASAGR